jgi:pimeloyl-ACP methyl ester carboxylesterase
MQAGGGLCNTSLMGDLVMYGPRRPPRSKEQGIRGVSCHVTEWGDTGAPLMVYLHGWADAGSTFQFVVDEFVRDWHVVAPDWRGFGRSDCDCESYWFPDYLADLNEWLETYSPEAPVLLVGHSMGANIASLYAGAMPERVRALVNIEGFGLPDSDPAEAPGRYRAWIEAGRAGESFSTYSDMGSLAARIARRHRGMGAGQSLFVARQWARERFDGTVVLRADPRHKLPNPVLYRRAEAEACWRAISADVLLVSGTDSEMAQRGLSALVAALPAARTAAIEGAGHMLHFERPAELASVIEAFLGDFL